LAGHGAGTVTNFPVTDYAEDEIAPLRDLEVEALTLAVRPKKRPRRTASPA